MFEEETELHDNKSDNMWTTLLSVLANCKDVVVKMTILRVVKELCKKRHNMMVLYRAGMFDVLCDIMSFILVPDDSRSLKKA